MPTDHAIRAQGWTHFEDTALLGACICSTCYGCWQLSGRLIQHIRQYLGVLYCRFQHPQPDVLSALREAGNHLRTARLQRDRPGRHRLHCASAPEPQRGAALRLPAHRPGRGRALRGRLHRPRPFIAVSPFGPSPHLSPAGTHA